MFERLLKIFLPVAFGVAFQTSTVHALGASSPSLTTGSVVIAQVQAGASSGDGAATQEFVSLYNNSAESLDLTGWCMANKVNVSFACFTAPAGTTLSLPAHAYALAASDTFAARYGGTYDSTWTTTNRTSGSLVGGSDTLSLLNANGTVTDVALWTTSLAGGSNLSRQWKDQATGVMLDTDATTDFKKLSGLTMPASGVIEHVTIIDVCANIDGAQVVIPTGYGLVGTDCVLDICPNLNGLQIAVPPRMKLAGSTCLYDVPRLVINELFPNAVGSDAGNEYIEIYNPGSETVDLSLYRLQVGPNFEKSYAFAPGDSIAAYQYRVFSNSDVAFTLLNTASRARLVTSDDQVISEAPLYVDPAENSAWAFLDDAWSFTNQPTPGLENLLSSESTTADGPVVVSSARPCAATHYRNPETNRCRAIVSTGTDIKPCKDGQYRSEETNRCRSIASDADGQKPCAENQFRNPDTGRCKKIASVDDVKDCGEGRERNQKTGRCRNIVTVASGKTDGGVEVVPAPAASVMGAWAAGIVGVIAAGYGALEWRREIGGWFGGAIGWVGNVFGRS